MVIVKRIIYERRWWCCWWFIPNPLNIIIVYGYFCSSLVARVKTIIAYKLFKWVLANCCIFGQPAPPVCGSLSGGYLVRELLRPDFGRIHFVFSVCAFVCLSARSKVCHSRRLRLTAFLPLSLSLSLSLALPHYSS